MNLLEKRIERIEQKQKESLWQPYRYRELRAVEDELVRLNEKYILVPKQALGMLDNESHALKVLQEYSSENQYVQL